MEPLYIDNHLLVLDKPWGLLTQPSGTERDSLEDQGKEYLRRRFQKPGAVFLEAVHRIDRLVGGVVLFARTSKALSRLNAAQRAGEFTKTYRARVSGGPKEPRGTLEDWLVHDDFCARVVSPKTPGAHACRLTWEVLEQADGETLLEIGLQTGRYHQIRAQLAHAGMPILGDRRYGGRPHQQDAIALVSWQLQFNHPVTKEPITVESRLKL